MAKSLTPTSYAVNIAWNSNHWRGMPSPGEGGGFGFVAEGGIPAESWNLDFRNPRNTRTLLYAYTPRIERARATSATMFLTSRAPDGKRFVVGLYVMASILRGNQPWRSSDSARPDGRNGYVNLAVQRQLATGCADIRLVPWNLHRHYGRTHGPRQWPGRQTFLILPEANARRLAADLIAAHKRWARDNPSRRAVADRVMAITRVALGEAQTGKITTAPPRTAVVPWSDVVVAERQKIKAERLLRNAPQLRLLKEQYGYLCQVDPQHRLDLPQPPPYIEVHHLEPVARGGILADRSFSNCVVVCPTCHILLQAGAVWIDPTDGRTIRHYAGDRRYEGRRLKLISGHHLDRTILRELASNARA